MKSVLNVLQGLRPQPCPYPLLRIGGNRDGAYLLPDDLQGIAACFSPGVATYKFFEDELVQRYGIACHLLIGSTEPSRMHTPLIDGMQTFQPRWLKASTQGDSISLGDWVASVSPRPEQDLLLQMDIEGGEYEALLATDDAVLASFRILVIELHQLSAARSPAQFERQLGPLLRKLDRQFLCVHVHPNNCCGEFQLPGTTVHLPNVMEVTWLRRDRVLQADSNVQFHLPLLPHPQDIRRNVLSREPLFLDSHWTAQPLAEASRIKQLEDQVDYLQYRIGELTRSVQTLERVTLHRTSVDVQSESLAELQKKPVTSVTPQRFVITKGVQGWGDRFQCLLQALRYARKTSRTLVIDWRDTDWTHHPEEPLEHWFTLKNPKTMPLAEFLKMYGEREIPLRVFPTVWEDCLENPEYSRWIYQPQYHLTPEQVQIEKIVQGAPDFDAEVVVYPGVGKRTFAYSDGKNLQLAPWLKKRILGSATELGLYHQNYDVLHLRGGSKSWAGGRVPLKSLSEQIHGAWPTKDAYFQDLHGKYLAALGKDAPRELILLTDHQGLGSDWIARYGMGRMIPTLNHHLKESGTHKMDAAQLERLGISKEDLNLEVLRDFCIMLNARRVIGDGLSVFSKMGLQCSLAGVRLVKFPDAPLGQSNNVTRVDITEQNAR